MMKKTTALSAFEVLTASPIIPVIAIKQLKDAVPLSSSLVNAAIRMVKEQVPNAIVGAGTVANATQYTQAIEAGAEFIISPGLTESLLQKSTEYAVPFIPGIATPSELMLASQYGLSYLKFFPAEINGGIKALQAFSGPFPEIKFCPTGGINEKNYRDYLALENVLCVGGTWFVPSEAIKQGDFERIAMLAKSAINNLAKKS